MWILFAIPFGLYLTAVHWQKWQNFEIDKLRAAAYESSKIDNSGIICDEDLVLKDGITRAWANQGGETKVYDPNLSRTSGSGSGSRGTGVLDQSTVSAEQLGNSFMSNQSFDQKMMAARHSTGSIDQIILEDDQERSLSVKFI